ncbi:MAG: hypothetical protein LBJ81_00935 [Puniceicoccales bacterium]|jgi:hypothetical protein|nr:hypothetical protein [Puniceicoccales bacterium]
MGEKRCVLGGVALLLGLAGGCQTAKDLPKSDFHFYIESKENSQNATWIPTAILPVSGLSVGVCSYPAFFPKDVEFARIVTSNFGKCILFKLTQQAAIELYKLSVECSGRKIVFAFNGKALGLSAPIDGTIMDGAFTIFPEVEESELETLVAEINDAATKVKNLKKN